MKPKALADLALKECGRRGADSASVLAAQSKEHLVRFSKNTVTLVAATDTLSLQIYLAIKKRRIVGATTDIRREAIRQLVENLSQACRSLPEGEFTSLPTGPFKYGRESNFDRTIDQGAAPLAAFVEAAIETARNAGASTVSGILSAASEESYLVTSEHVEAADHGTRISLNVRAFADRESSGHGLSCSPGLHGFDPSEAGRQAGEFAKRSVNPGPWTGGTYDVILSPTVVADLVNRLGLFSSAFYVDAGVSFLRELEKGPANEMITVHDVGVCDGSFGGRMFDDEGVPTQDTPILEKGVVKNYLHNSHTAQKSASSTTGNAGVIVPHPWNLVVGAGSSGLEEMIREVKKGFLITNNWYTRFQNISRGEYSTVPRDAAFYIESGEIKHPVTGLRISGSIPANLRDVVSVSKERRWIQWWEVKIPTLAPYMLIKNVVVSKAVS